MASASTTHSSSTSPYRQIRAQFTPATITLYQAYPSSIAIPAVEHQKLNASPTFSMTRMTWVKPSWAWMLYRAGYSYKDNRQSHIIAIKLKHETFISLLKKVVLAHNSNNNAKANPSENSEKAAVGEKEEGASVRVQWDPERTVRLEKLPYRSIQIGIPGALVPEFVEGIVEIEDVTERARELKRVLDEEVNGKIGVGELIERSLVPVEKEFVVDEDVRRILGMETEGLE